MKHKVLNLAWPLVALAAALLIGGAVWGIGAAMNVNPTTGAAYPNQLANGAATPGKFVRAGYCTDTATSTSTADRQCWASIRASDVQGLSGTTNYIPKKTASGWGDSQVFDDGSHVQIGIGTSVSKLSVTGAIESVGNAVLADPSYGFRSSAYLIDSANPIWSFAPATGYGLSYYQDNGSHPIRAVGDAIGFHFGVVLSPVFYVKADGSIIASGGLSVKNLPGKGAGKVLYDIDGAGTIGEKTISELPSGGTPGQIPQVTATGTGTGWTLSNGTIDFDPMGTFFFDTCNSECAAVYPWHLGSLSRMQSYVSHTAGASPTTLTATCSTGSDAVFEQEESLVGGLIIPSSTEQKATGFLWPAGAWMARLRAKVNANGAAIRVHVYEIDSNTYAATEWFNFTTGTFSNTAFATVEKLTAQAQRIPAVATNYIGFRFYATCSTSTTVSLEFGDAALTTRIESPIVVDRLYTSDVWGLDTVIAEKEPVQPSGLSGQALCYTSTSTSVTTSKTACDRDPVISGTPGGFVKIATSTGTAISTSKEVVTLTIPTPVTVRYFTIQASDFLYGSGATATALSSNLATWKLRDGQTDYVYSSVLRLPADYVSGLAVSVMWSPSATDGVTTHKVRWAISVQSLANGGYISFGSGNTWTGDACDSYCSSGGIVKEAAHSLSSISSGVPYAISFQRDSVSTADTYVGDVRLIALEFSYTSSL